MGIGFGRSLEHAVIYVRSERAGQRVMESISRFITQKLKLKVNEAKSALRDRKVESTDRPNRKRWLKARTRGGITTTVTGLLLLAGLT
jgi:hypothetical protein